MIRYGRNMCFHNSSVGTLALGDAWITAAEFSLRELVFLEAAEETPVLCSSCEDEVPSGNKEVAPHQTQTCWCPDSSTKFQASV